MPSLSTLRSAGNSRNGPNEALVPRAGEVSIAFSGERLTYCRCALDWFRQINMPVSGFRLADRHWHFYHRQNLEMNMKILLPVDGSDYTKRMLSYIAAHDELLGPGHQYVFFTAVAPVPPHAAHFLNRQTLELHYREQAEEVFRPVKRFADQHGWSSRASHAAGHPAEAIAAFADVERPDLIVMGTHGHSALGNMILGSVGSGVLARCSGPVLLVR
jgi:nucleotide-binding universal stress UspA family protein